MSDTSLPETLSVDNDRHDHHNRHIGDVGDGGDDAALLLTSPGEGMPADDPVTIIEAETITTAAHRAGRVLHYKPGFKQFLAQSVDVAVVTGEEPQLEITWTPVHAPFAVCLGP